MKLTRTACSGSGSGMRKQKRAGTENTGIKRKSLKNGTDCDKYRIGQNKACGSDPHALFLLIVSEEKSAAAAISAESAAAAEEKDDPQAAVISAAVPAECVSATSATAAEEKDKPQTGRHTVSVFASASAVCSS